MMSHLAIKGFDKDLKCRCFQYKAGEVFKHDGKIRLCSSGLHYCNTFDDVLRFYPNRNGNRYFIVEILGEYEEGIDKCATNKLRLVEEFMPSALNKFHKQMYGIKELKKLNDLGYVIGGSLALLIHGYKIDRSIKDIDLITDITKDEDLIAKIEKDFKGKKRTNIFSGRDSFMGLTGIYGEKYDILCLNEIPSVKRVYNGIEFKIMDEVAIWQYKLNYALNGNIKHMDDIKLNGIHFDMRPKQLEVYDDMMPF